MEALYYDQDYLASGDYPRNTQGGVAISPTIIDAPVFLEDYCSVFLKSMMELWNTLTDYGKLSTHEPVNSEQCSFWKLQWKTRITLNYLACQEGGRNWHKLCPKTLVEPLLDMISMKY